MLTLYPSSQQRCESREDLARTPFSVTDGYIVLKAPQSVRDVFIGWSHDDPSPEGSSWGVLSFPTIEKIDAGGTVCIGGIRKTDEGRG
jgi:hypothetical protein